MQPALVNGNVRAHCPDCQGAITTFEWQTGGTAFGSFVQRTPSHWYGRRPWRQISYVLLRCSTCSRGGLAKIHDDGDHQSGILEWFVPTITETLRLPEGVPDGVRAEFREAEACANVSAWRAASAMLRSTLEKLLAANGYQSGSLAARIDEAVKDQVITAARSQRAHDDVRVLGNDILHDQWRAVTSEEYDLAHHYVQRISEDLYDDRPTVEKMLRALKRIT